MEYKMTTHAKSQENQSNVQGGKKKKQKKTAHMLIMIWLKS